MELRSCDVVTAQDIVETTDLARRRFVKTNFGADVEDPHTYDLVVSTERLSSKAVAAIVMEGLRQRRSARQGS